MKIQIRRRFFVFLASTVAGLAILAYWLPGPIEGAYSFPFESCCGEGYEFYYFKTNVALIISEHAPPAFRFGTSSRTNDGWYFDLQNKTNNVRVPIKPRLMFMEIDTPPRQVRAWRSLRLLKVKHVLNDPSQWESRKKASK